MKKYTVTLTTEVTYDIVANTEKEASNKAELQASTDWHDDWDVIEIEYPGKDECCVNCKHCTCIHEELDTIDCDIDNIPYGHSTNHRCCLYDAD
jgi:hypothetical protein